MHYNMPYINKILYSKQKYRESWNRKKSPYLDKCNCNNLFLFTLGQFENHILSLTDYNGENPHLTDASGCTGKG